MVSKGYHIAASACLSLVKWLQNLHTCNDAGPGALFAISGHLSTCKSLGYFRFFFHIFTSPLIPYQHIGMTLPGPVMSCLTNADCAQGRRQSNTHWVFGPRILNVSNRTEYSKGYPIKRHWGRGGI